MHSMFVLLQGEFKEFLGKKSMIEINVQIMRDEENLLSDDENVL